jgi:hypothetical protein
LPITWATDVQMPNARAFSISTLQDLSNDTKNTPMRGVLGPAVELWTFGSPGGLQIRNFSKCWASPPHLAKLGLRHLSTTPLLSNKSTSEVFLAPLWYVNVKSEVGKHTNLAMLELVTRLWTPFTTCEPTECLSKVLNGTHVACGSRIGRGPDVVFRVSFNIAIMSLVLNFKSWKLSNGVFTSYCAISCIWS